MRRCPSTRGIQHQVAIGERIGATQPSGVYDVVIEAAGSESALHRSAELARPGGTVGVLGVFGPEVAWPQLQFFLKEIRTVPSLGYCSHGKGRDFVDAAAMLAANPDLVRRDQGVGSALDAPDRAATLITTSASMHAIWPYHHAPKP